MLGALVAVAVATAPASQRPQPPAPAAAAKPADPLVCHLEPLEGSRITHKVCLRASEVRRQQQEARDNLGRMQGSLSVPMANMGPMH